VLHDTTLKPEDRVDGLVVLLYAQQVFAISQLTDQPAIQTVPPQAT
jgi:hypothetical protein